MCPKNGQGKKEPFRKENCTGKSCEGKQDNTCIRVCDLIRSTFTEDHPGDSKIGGSLDPKL